MREQRHTICRACHAGCGVIVELENGQPVAVKGDPDNPVYQGFCCVKGQNMAAQWANPNRLLHSQKRQPDGSFQPISSEQAMDEIAGKIRQLVDDHGPRSVSTYTGTMASVTTPVVTPLLGAFMQALGSPMTFTSNTIDQPGKMVARALFGGWMAPENHFSNAKVALLIGINPLVAMSGGVPFTNPGRALTDALKRGLDLIVIDPRRSECARRAKLHLQPKPGEDVTIVAGLIHIILSEQLEDADFVRENIDGVDALRSAVAPFTPAMVAERADIPADALVDAARRFANAGSGVATAGTGPNMSGHTTLLEYLLLCLNSICGRWQRAGERVVEPNILAFHTRPKAQAAAPSKAFAYGFGEHIRVRNLRNTAAGLPTAALAEEILMPGEGQVRALISHGGNPVAAWPDQLKTLEALRALELMVQVDVTLSASAREADYVIAAKHPLEMAGMSLPQEYMSGYAPGFGSNGPYGQYTPALVEPPEGSDVVEDWEFYYGLAQRLNLPLEIKPVAWAGDVVVPMTKLDMHNKPSADQLFDILTQGSRIPLDTVKQFPAGKVFDEPAEYVAEKDPDCDARMDAGDAAMMADLAEVATNAVTTTYPWRLISRRQINMYNSIGADMPGQTHGRTYNPAYMHPDDIAALGMKSGDKVQVRSARATIPGIVQADKNLRRGIVSMTHAWGGAPERDDDYLEIGASTGRLTAVDSDFERYTGLPRMSNIPVEVLPASA